MKLVSVEKNGPSLPADATELPDGTFLQGKKYGHVYKVDQGEVVRVSDGHVSDDTAMSNYDIIPPGSKLIFEVPAIA